MRRISTVHLLPLFAFSIILSSCATTKATKSTAKNPWQEGPFATAHVGVSIMDATTGKYVYDHQGDKYFIPASNTKIPTLYAALRYLSDSIEALKYHLAGDGTLYVVPTGDPTLLHSDFQKHPAMELFQSAAVKKIVWTTAPFRTTHWGSGWAWNDYQQYYSAERSPLPIYGNVVEFDSLGNSVPPVMVNSTETISDGKYRITRNFDGVFTQQKANSRFTGGTVTFAATPAFISQQLSQHLQKEVSFTTEDFTKQYSFQSLYSQSLDAMLRPLMLRSDNFYAEQVLLMVSNKLFGVLDEDRTIDTLLKTEYKDLPHKPRWADGSGLSRYNHFTPQDMIYIIRKMVNEFGLPRIRSLFSTGGEGTIRNFYLNDKGFIYGKTGTLTGVVGFSGFMIAKSGKLYYFSTMINNHHADAVAIRRGVEKFLQDFRATH